MSNFTQKQVTMFSALRAVRAAAFACDKDLDNAKVLYSAYEAIVDALAQDIGSAIINKELKEDFT